MKPIQIVHFGFNDAPEAFHWAIVYTAANTGHALGCADAI